MGEIEPIEQPIEKIDAFGPTTSKFSADHEKALPHCHEIANPNNAVQIYNKATELSASIDNNIVDNVHNIKENFNINFGVMKFTAKTDNNLPIKNPPLKQSSIITAILADNFKGPQSPNVNSRLWKSLSEPHIEQKNTRIITKVHKSSAPLLSDLEEFDLLVCLSMSFCSSWTENWIIEY